MFFTYLAKYFVFIFVLTFFGLYKIYYIAFQYKKDYLFYSNPVFTYGSNFNDLTIKDSLIVRYPT